jgi:hypothetical protein
MLEQLEHTSNVTPRRYKPSRGALALSGFETLSREVSRAPELLSLLDMGRPEVATLVAAMTRAREAVERRSWSPPLEHAGDDWWADVLADPRARVTTRRARDADGRSFYRLADETRATS